jgi:hypothetical protein
MPLYNSSQARTSLAALFHEFVRDLSDGNEVILGGGGAAGAALSGGQKQRLAIARARLKNPSIPVLGQSSFSSTMNIPFTYIFFFRTDEATSALDSTSRWYSKLSSAGAKTNQRSLSLTIVPTSNPTTGCSNRGFGTIWRLNPNTDMKGRSLRVLENF